MVDQWTSLFLSVACSGTLTRQNGLIESIGFSQLYYPDNLLCEWFLHGPEIIILTLVLKH